MGFFSRSRLSRTDVDAQTVANTAANTPNDAHPAYNPRASMLKTKSRASTTSTSTSSSTLSSRSSSKSHRKSRKTIEPTPSETTSLIPNNPHKCEKANKHNSYDQHLIDCWKQANGHHYTAGNDSSSPGVFWSWS